MAGSRAIEAARAFVSIYANDEKLRKTLAGSKAAIQDLNKQISGPAFTAGFAAIAAGGVGVLTVAASAEQTAVAFEVMLGSGERARKMLADIYELGKASPFRATDFQQAGKTLMQFGIETEQVVPVLSMLGDIAGGDAEKLSRLSMVFGQMSASGRLMGQDLLQFINSGFNPLQQIAAKTGESMVELKKRMEAGGISAAEVTQAFSDATSEGGRFYGMTQRIAKTTGGVWMTLQDEIGMLAKQMGDLLLPIANQVLGALRGLVVILGDYPKTIVVTAGAIMGLVAAIKIVNAALTVYAMRQAIATALTGPKGWVILAGAVAAAGATLYAMNAATKETAAVTEEAKAPLDVMAKEMAAMEQATAGMNTQAKEAPQNLDALRDKVASLIDPLGDAKREAQAFAEELAKSGEVTQQQGAILVRTLIEDRTGFSSMVEDMASEIRKLEGTATDASIALEQMAAAGVDPARIAALQKMIDQRDALTQKQADDQFYSDKQKQMQDAATQIKDAIQTAGEALAKEQKRLQVLVNAGLITSDQAQKFLEQNPEFKALLDGTDLQKKIAESVGPTGPAQDLRSVSGAGQLTGIINQQGALGAQQVQILRQIQTQNARLLTVTERGQIGFAV
jgi:tape measure domain-containing protein